MLVKWHRNRTVESESSGLILCPGSKTCLSSNGQAKGFRARVLMNHFIVYIMRIPFRSEFSLMNCKMEQGLEAGTSSPVFDHHANNNKKSNYSCLMIGSLSKMRNASYDACNLFSAV